MIPFSFAGLLTGVSSVGFGLFVLLMSQNRKIAKIWFLFTLSVSGWGFGVLWIGYTKSAAEGLLAWRIAYALGVIWIAPLFYHFVCIFLELRRNRSIYLQYFITACFLLTVPTSLFFCRARWVFNSFYYGLSGKLYPFYFAWWIGLVVYSHLQLIWAYKLVSPKKKIQIKYFIFAMAAAYGGGSLAYLPNFGIDVYPWGTFAIVLYPVINSIAIAKHRLMDIELVARATLTKVLAWGLCSVPFGIGMILGHFLSSRPGFLYHRGPGDLICVALNYSLALTLLQNYKDRLCDRLRYVFMILGTWELSILVLTAPPYGWSHLVYRSGYALGAWLVWALFSYLVQFFENVKDDFSTVLRWSLKWTALIVAAMAIFTPWFIRSLQFDVSGQLLAKEIPGNLYWLYGVWFITFLSLMGLWTIRAIRRMSVKTSQPLKIWIMVSLGTATAAAVAYFLFAIGRLSWFYYTPLEAVMCFSLTAALSHRMRNSAHPMDFGFGAMTLVAPFATGVAVMCSPIWRAAGLFLAVASSQRIIKNIESTIQAWVDQTPFFRKKFGHLLMSAKKAKEIKLLDSFQEALPIAAEQVLEAFPFCRSATIIVRFTDQDNKPGDRSVKVRQAENRRIVEAAPWPIEAELALLDLIRNKGGLILRDNTGDWPSTVQTLDPWFLEAAIPLKAGDEIVGMIVLGPKDDGTLLHDKDLEILGTMAETLSDQMSSIIAINKFRYLVNNILHDALNYMRTPLGKLELKEALNEADTSSLRKQNKILRQLRNEAHQAISALKKEEFPPTNVEGLLRDAALAQESAAKQKGLMIDIKISSPLPEPRLDPLLIDRCVGNLLNNAIKYTLRGRILISARQESSWLVVSVTDTGLGIPKESLARIFDSGYRVPGKHSSVAEGTGIGLANVREHMLIMGGRIEVKSELHKGSEFSLWFPILDGEALRAKAA